MSRKAVWSLRNKVLMSIAVPVCLMSAPVGAQSTAEPAGDPQEIAQNSLLDRKYELKIAAQKVSAAVLELSRQADIQILMPGRTLDAYSAPAVAGQLSLREALEQILAGTGYSFRQADGNIVVVEAPQAADGGESAAEPEEGSASSQVTQLDDVVVTATKREKSSRELPVSLTALRGEDLEKTGARNIKDYIMLAPGITLDEGETGEATGRRMTIRGVGPGQGGVGNQTVGQFLGDAPIGDPYTNYGIPDIDPFDLKTVEILRGPQGTTFGASALNGAVRYVPNDPVLNELSGRGFIDYQTVHEGDSGFAYGLAGNAPLGSKAAFRASGIMQNVPGYYDNLRLNAPDSNSVDRWSGRAAARWEPTDRLSANLMTMKQHSHTDDVLVATNGDGVLENTDKNAPGYINFDFSMTSLDLRYRLDNWGTVVLQGTRQSKLSDGSVNAGATVAPFYGATVVNTSFRTDATSDTQELRLVSPEGGNWDWIVGAFRRGYEANVDAGVHTDTVPDFVSAEVLPLNAKETALYGELTRRFAERWEATLGARQYTTKLSGVFVGKTMGVTAYNQPIEQTESGLNPKLSLSYKYSKSLMGYASISRGFQFGGVNIAAAMPGADPSIPQTYGSSELWNREVGLRTDWLDRTLRLDVALYDIKWTKAQLAQKSPPLPPLMVGQDYINNVGEVSSRGVESTFTWLTPVPGLSTSIVASYVNAKTASDYANGPVVTPSGTQLPAAPRWQTASSVAYSTYFGPWITGGSAVYTQWGKAYDDIQHTNEIYDFGMLDLNFNVARPDLKFMPSVNLGISNLLDERGVVGRSSQAPIPPTWTYTRPRTISLRFSAEFS